MRGGEAMELASQKSFECPISGRVHGQVGRGFEQPGLLEVVPSHGSGVGTRWS